MRTTFRSLVAAGFAASLLAGCGGDSGAKAPTAPAVTANSSGPIAPKQVSGATGKGKSVKAMDPRDVPIVD